MNTDLFRSTFVSTVFATETASTKNVAVIKAKKHVEKRMQQERTGPSYTKA